MGIRITDKLVNELAPPAKGNKITYDAPDTGPRQDKGVSGFGIRITAKGVRAFILNYRADGRERRMKIGRYPDWSVEAARKKARELRRAIDGGCDPLAARVERQKAPSINDLCDGYVEEHLPRKRASGAANDLSMIDKIIRPRLGKHKVAGVEYRDLVQLHHGMKDTPYRANRVLALVSKMFSLAVKWGWRSENPAKGVERFQEEKRDRYLSKQEIAHLSQTLANYEDQSVADIVRMLLLTGARCGEVFKAEWSQFDLKGGSWTKPAATTKQKKLHRVPLSDGALSLLKGLSDGAPRQPDGTLTSPYLFPGPRSGKPRTEINDEWKAIALAAGLHDVVPAKEANAQPIRKVNCRLHDLRHTYASVLASAGQSLPIIGALLGHTQASTTLRYAHLMDDPLRLATNAVSAVVTGEKSAEVVRIGGRIA